MSSVWSVASRPCRARELLPRRPELGVHDEEERGGRGEPGPAGPPDGAAPARPRAGAATGQRPAGGGARRATAARTRARSAGGGGTARQGPRQERERLARLADPRGADRAARGEVSLELGELPAVEGADRVDVGLLEPLVVVHARSVPLRAARMPRSRSSPLRMRVFTVPSGSPSRAAISVCVRPSK